MFQFKEQLHITVILHITVYVFTDHKQLLHCFTKNNNLSPRFYPAQMQLTKFSKLEIIQTPGKKSLLLIR